MGYEVKKYFIYAPRFGAWVKQKYGEPVTEMEKTARGTNLGGKTGNPVLDGFSWLCVTL